MKSPVNCVGTSWFLGAAGQGKAGVKPTTPQKEGAEPPPTSLVPGGPPALCASLPPPCAHGGPPPAPLLACFTAPLTPSSQPPLRP